MQMYEGREGGEKGGGGLRAGVRTALWPFDPCYQR